MTTKRTVLAISAVCLFGVVLASVILEKKPNIIPLIGTGEKIAIKRIRVISGHEFDILLENKKRIHGQLRVVTPTGPGSEAARKVTALLNSCTDPKVEMFESNDDFLWKVELYFKVNKEDVVLSEWLRRNGLIWE